MNPAHSPAHRLSQGLCECDVVFDAKYGLKVRFAFSNAKNRTLLFSALLNASVWQPAYIPANPCCRNVDCKTAKELGAVLPRAETSSCRLVFANSAGYY